MADPGDARVLEDVDCDLGGRTLLVVEDKVPRQARDHRLIDTQQELLFFHPLSPGSCFFPPHAP